jgi:predicted metal-binding membrane protein
VTALESLLNRERVVVASALSALIILAWIYLLRGAGMGMTALAFFPHAAMPNESLSSESAASHSSERSVRAPRQVVLVLDPVLSVCG